MKKVWNVPDVEELTIQATSCKEWGWNGGRPDFPNNPNRPGNSHRPGGFGWGNNMSPEEFHPEDGTSSF